MQTSENWPSRPSGYSLEQVIGKGAFGVVYSAKVLSGLHTNQKVAIKKIDLEDFPDHSLEDIRQELLLTRLSLHPNVVSYHTSFLSSHYLWLVMPLFEGGSVGCILKQKFPYGVKDISLVASILKDTLSALAYFHQNRQIHRDVKAANLLVNGDGRVMLSDFGVAAKLKQGMNAKTFVGSPCWMAPEVIDSDNYRGYDYKADIWSLGCLVVEMATGKPPWHYKTNPVSVFMHVCNTEELPRLPDLSSEAKDFIFSCFRREPTERPNVCKLLKHRFIKSENPAPLVDFEGETIRSEKVYNELLEAEEQENLDPLQPEGLNPLQKLQGPFGSILSLSNVNVKAKPTMEDFVLRRPSSSSESE